MTSPPPPLPRRLLAEFLGSAFLAALVIGSGIAAQQLSAHDLGLELFENAAATGAGLFAIILMFGPVSGGQFAKAAVSFSTHQRASPSHLLAEAIATFGLLLVIFSLARTRRVASAPAAVGAYIGAAYFFTSSTSFANPAIAAAAIRTLYPQIPPRDAATFVVPHPT